MGPLMLILCVAWTDKQNDNLANLRASPEKNHTNTANYQSLFAIVLTAPFSVNNQTFFIEQQRKSA